MRPTFGPLAISLFCLIYSASLHAQSVEQSESYRECLALNSTAAEGGKIICEEAEKLKAVNGQTPQAPAAPAPSQSVTPEEAAQYERQLRSSCEAELNKAESACTPTAYSTPEASGGSGMGSAAAAAGKLSDNIGKQATQQVAACTDAVRQCRLNCVTAYKSLKARCSGECGNEIYSPIRQLTLSCDKQLARQTGNKEQTKIAEKNKEEAQKIADKIENKPTDLFPKNPGSGDSIANSGGSGLGSSSVGGSNSGVVGSSVASNGSGGGITLPKVQTASVNPDPKSAKPSSSSSTDDKSLKEKSNRGLFGSAVTGDAVLESENMGMNGMRGGYSPETAALYRALMAKTNERTAATPTTATTAAKAESQKSAELAQGKGGFTTTASARRPASASGGIQPAPNNDAYAAGNSQSARARSGMQTQSINGAPIQQANNNGEFNSKEMNSEGSRGPASASDDNSYGELNGRMRMQRGDATGSSNSPSSNSIPLSAYLPNGSMYRPQRGPAGANLPADGIQSQGVDIWSLISKRMQARCLDGRLRDCR